jgi:hypothetical protein
VADKDAGKKGGKSRVPLSEVLAEVAEELFKADQLAKERGFAAMQFDECELEFAVRTEYAGKAGVKLYVVNLGAGGKRAETNIVRVKFTSVPDRPPLQAGQQIEGDGGA